MSVTKDYLLQALVLALAAGAVFLFYKIMVPFFVPIIWAGIFAIMFHSLFERLAVIVKNRSVASLCITLLIIVIIIGPVAFVSVQLIQQAIDAVNSVKRLYDSGELDRLLTLDIPWLAAIREQMASRFNIQSLSVDQMVPQILDKASGFIVGQASNLLANSAKVMLNFVLMLVATYYLVRDGHLLVSRVKSIIPLPADQVNKLVHDLRGLISVTMYSGVAVAALQGVLGWLLFTIMGIESAVFWGAVMGFLSLLPLFGAFLIYIPAGLFLMVSGSPIKGIITIAIGTVVVSQVDNLIRPWIISGKVQMHPLLTFFSMLGGIAVFGFVGVVVGPVVAALFVVLLDIIAVRKASIGKVFDSPS